MDEIDQSSSAAPRVLNIQVASLFRSETFSDVTIYCGDQYWYAHKVVICTQSSFFMKACEGAFMEANTGEITLKDDDPEVVNALLSYLYTSDYDVEPAAATSFETLIFHVHVFALAEKFFVDPLLRIAANKFSEWMQANWKLEHLTNSIKEWSATSTDPDNILGEKLVEVAMQHRDGVMRDKSFQQVLHQTPWLAAEIATRVHTQLMHAFDERFLLCSACCKMFKARFESTPEIGMTCPYCGDYASCKYWEEHCEWKLEEAVYDRW